MPPVSRPNDNYPAAIEAAAKRPDGRARRGTTREATSVPDRQESGFTLVELLVVLAILALLVTLTAPQVLKYIGTSKISTTKLQIENFATALDLYKIDVGRYPSNDEGLAALLKAPATAEPWAGPYVKGKNTSLQDPWGHAYVYRFPGQHGDYDLYSQGPEATNTGSADAGAQAITNW